MPYVIYPFSVKHDGKMYDPRTPIMVDDAEQAIKDGASVADESEAEEKPSRRGRPKKNPTM